MSVKKEQITKTGYWWTELPEGKRRQLMQKAFENIGELHILDESGRIVYLSEEYCKNMRVEAQKSLGRYIADVIDNTELTKVLQTKKETIGAIYHRNGNTFLVNRIPLFENGAFIGIAAQSLLTSGTGTDSASRQKLSRYLQELNYYKEKYMQMSAPQSTLDKIIGKSEEMRNLKDILRTVASTRSTVLITGESGTGKEVFAQALHNLSNRKNKPFIKLNCAAIPDTLLESELFGYAEGAFTGALKGGKIGDFEAANGGTLFLDEVDSLSPNMQAKLLRVIQEREVKKLGRTAATPIDVRLIFATNKDLYAMMKEGKFRDDFYYRINVIHLHLPELRHRKEDVPLLINFFVRKLNGEMGRQIDEVSPEAMAKLESYSWPGNIRELENCLERAFVYCIGNTLEAKHIIFPEDRKSRFAQLNREEQEDLPPQETETLKQARDRAEKAAIMRALKQCGGKKKEAAERLEIDRSVLYDKIKKYALDDEN